MIAAVGLACLALIWLARRGPSNAEPLESSAGPEGTHVDAGAPPRASMGAYAGSVMGRVLAAGQPVPEAQVWLSGVFEASTRTDGQGAFRLDEVLPGEIYLRAFAGDQSSALIGPILVTPGATSSVELTLAPSRALRGRVVEADTRAPIVGAGVLLSGATTRTDEKGRFELSPCPAGALLLTVTAAGFVGRTEWVHVAEDAPAVDLELTLGRGVNVRGVVRGIDAAALTNVWAEAVDALAALPRCGPVRADPDGGFAMACAPGTFQLAAGNAVVSKALGPIVTLSPGADRDGVVIDLSDTDGVTGVARLDGQPVAGLTITILDAATERFAAQVTTGPDGRFRSARLAFGTYVVAASREGRVLSAGPFEHAPGRSDWSVEFVAGLRVAGRVEPPVVGTVVTVKSRQTSAQVRVTETTGAFAFTGLVPGDVALEANGPGGWARGVAPAGSADVVLRLSSARIIVYASDDSGGPMSEFTAAASGPMGVAPIRERTVGPRASVELHVAPGAWTVRGTAEGFAETDPVPVTVGDGAASVHLQFARGRAYSGTVRAEAGGAPVAGAEVTAFSMRSRGASRRVQRVTDAAGRFTLTAFPEDFLFVRSGTMLARGQVRAFPVDGRGELDVRLTQPPRAAPGFDPQAPYDGVGMVLEDAKGKIRVQSVFPGSPAEEVGVAPGDVIVAIDGAPSPPPVDAVAKRILGPRGSVVVIEFERGAERRVLAVRRRTVRP